MNNYTISHTLPKGLLGVISGAAKSAEEIITLTMGAQPLANVPNRKVAANENLMGVFSSNDFTTPTFNDTNTTATLKLGAMQDNIESVSTPIFTEPTLTSQTRMGYFNTTSNGMMSTPISNGISLKSNGKQIEPKMTRPSTAKIISLFTPKGLV